MEYEDAGSDRFLIKSRATVNRLSPSTRVVTFMEMLIDNKLLKPARRCNFGSITDGLY